LGEIKFRAWDKKRKVMYAPFDLYWKANQNNPPEDFVNAASATWSPNTIFLQYTGLKDSLVAEEYFDDVIEEDDGTRRVIGDGYSAVLFMDIKTGDIKYFWELKPHKVIGNIHQNPELLETK